MVPEDHPDCERRIPDCSIGNEARKPGAFRQPRLRAAAAVGGA